MTTSLVVGFLINASIFTYFFLLHYLLEQVLVWEHRAGHGSDPIAGCLPATLPLRGCPGMAERGAATHRPQQEFHGVKACQSLWY